MKRLAVTHDATGLFKIYFYVRLTSQEDILIFMQPVHCEKESLIYRHQILPTRF